jgi:hypothetical protein
MGVSPTCLAAGSRARHSLSLTFVASIDLVGMPDAVRQRVTAFAVGFYAAARSTGFSPAGLAARTGLNPLAISQTARTISCRKIGSAMGT